MNAPLLIHNATVVNRGAARPGWVAVESGVITATGQGPAPEALLRTPGIDIHDLSGRLLMPGAIDTHVHFREPGMTHKATMASESRAALAGGVTSVIDMPNTVPPTVSIEAWEHKMELAAASMAVNYAFFIGATRSNTEELLHADYTRVAGVKVFMGSSTGGMLLDDDDALVRVWRDIPALVAVHAEDQAIVASATARAIEAASGAADLPVEMHPTLRPREACTEATRRAVAMARRYGTRLHVAHVSTADELQFAAEGYDVAAKRITFETAPQYLLFDSADYHRLGARIKCNPAIKEASDREALRRAVASGLIDTVATDHAPHLLTEKTGGALKAVSGMPMVQFSLPVMLGLYDAPTVARVMAHNPAVAFGIEGRGFIEPGYAADMAVVEETAPYTVTDADTVSLCRWTPLAGTVLRHRVVRTYLAAPTPLRFRN